MHVLFVCYVCIREAMGLPLLFLVVVLLLHVKEKGEGGGSHGTSGEVSWWGQHVTVACERLRSARGLGVGALWWRQ
jgi:hypothetical protein